MDLKKLKEENERLKKALEFYANEETYFKVTKTVRERPIGTDLGAKARAALWSQNG